MTKAMVMVMIDGNDVDIDVDDVEKIVVDDEVIYDV